MNNSTHWVLLVNMIINHNSTAILLHKQKLFPYPVELDKARNASLKLLNFVNFHAPFSRNHVHFTHHDRPPLLKGHHLAWPLWRGSIVYSFCILRAASNNIYQSSSWTEIFQTHSSIIPISRCCTLKNFKTNTNIANHGYTHLIIHSTYLYQLLITVVNEMIR